MSNAGQQLVAGRIPGERIATTVATAASATFTTTETTVASVTAALVNARIYRVRFVGRWSSTVAGDDVVSRIRQDSATGTEMASAFVRVLTTALPGWISPIMEVEFTAAATGDKTFVCSAVRDAGTGNCSLKAATTRPAYIYVDYIRG